MVSADPEPVVLVTGSSSGIGASVARRFAAEGYKVGLNSWRSAEAGTQLADELGGSYVAADISDPQQAERLVAQTTSKLGRLDVLINCAGTTAVIKHDDLDAVTADVWRRIFDVNVLGTWNVTAQAVPHLKEAGNGQVINITSTSGTRPAGSSIPYAVSKAGLNHMTQLLAKALGPHIRVNAVAP